MQLLWKKCLIAQQLNTHPQDQVKNSSQSFLMSTNLILSNFKILMILNSLKKINRFSISNNKVFSAIDQKQVKIQLQFKKPIQAIHSNNNQEN